MNIKFNNLRLQWEAVERACRKRMDKLHQESSYILGNDVETFEKNFAEYLGCKYAIGVSSGLDALKIALRSLDYQGAATFFVPAHTFIATAISVKLAYPDAKIVLVDCDQYFQIDPQRLRVELNRYGRNKNKAIVPVHLYGHTVDAREIEALAEEYHCDIVEDASQSHGSQFEDGNFTGTLGRCAAFSLYPGKNLGAIGDAGIIVTNDENLRANMLRLRNYGSVIKYEHECLGYNNRLDSIQAIVLDEKLKFLYDWNASRSEIAKIYLENIDSEEILLPSQADYCGFHSYHVFSILCDDRDDLKQILEREGIPTTIYYPTPIELSEPFKHLKANNLRTREYSKKLLGLPIHPFMTRKEAMYVCSAINSF